MLRGKAIWNANGGFVSVLLTHLLIFNLVALGDKQPSDKGFPTMGAFSRKFSIAPIGKTTDLIKKVRGCKNDTDLLCHHAYYGGDRGSLADGKQKSVIFWSVFKHLTLL